MNDKLATTGGGIAPRTIRETHQLAVVLSKASGFVPRAMEGRPSAIMAAIITGAELGVGPMQSLRSIHVIDGRPTLAADLMLALAIKGGVRHQWLASDAKVARIKLTRPGFEPMTHAFTLDEARAAGLTGRNNWKKYPAAMLRARCLSSALTAFCPDVLGSGVYVDGEIDPDGSAPSMPDPDPDVVDVDPGPVSDEHPRRLNDVQTPAQLERWLQTHGQALVDVRGVEEVERYAYAKGTALGVESDDVERWLHGSTETNGEAA